MSKNSLTSDSQSLNHDLNSLFTVSDLCRNAISWEISECDSGECETSERPLKIKNFHSLASTRLSTKLMFSHPKQEPNINFPDVQYLGEIFVHPR